MNLQSWSSALAWYYELPLATWQTWCSKVWSLCKYHLKSRSIYPDWVLKLTQKDSTRIKLNLKSRPQHQSLLSGRSAVGCCLGCWRMYTDKNGYMVLVSPVMEDSTLAALVHQNCPRKYPNLWIDDHQCINCGQAVAGSGTKAWVFMWRYSLKLKPALSWR